MSIKQNLKSWETSKRIVASCEYGKKIGEGWSSRWKNITESTYQRGENNDKRINYIIKTGRNNNLFVVDLDIPNKNGNENETDGLEYLNNKLSFDILKSSYSTKTPSGGYHIYYNYTDACDGIMNNSRVIVDTSISLVPSIDIRTNGGCIMGEGSKVNDKKYVKFNSDILNIVDPPEELMNLLHLYAIKTQPSISIKNHNHNNNYKTSTFIDKTEMDFDLYSKCLDCISSERLNNYNEYIKFVFLCKFLQNSDDGKSKCQEVCEKDSKFDFENFNKTWCDGNKSYSYSPFTLLKMAKNDNGDRYESELSHILICNDGLYTIDDINTIIKEGLKTLDRLATALQRYLKYNFITFDSKEILFYYLGEENIWYETNGNSIIGSKIVERIQKLTEHYKYYYLNKISKFQKGKNMATDIQNSYNDNGVLLVKAKKLLQEKYGDCIDDFKNVLSIVKLINDADKLEIKASLHISTIITKSLKFIINKQRFDEVFNINKDILSVNNGVIEFNTMTLRKRRAEDRFTYKIPTDYIADIDTTYIYDVINNNFINDPNNGTYLQSFIGYGLTGYTNQQKLLVIHGSGSNMKSIIDSQCQYVLGDTIYHTMSKEALTITSGNNDELYNLKSARICSINETCEDDKFNWNSIKKLTGGDTIEVSAKFKGVIKFINQSCPIIFTNNKLKLPVDAVLAEKRRVAYIHSEKQYLDMKNKIDKLEWSQFKEDQGLIGVKDPKLGDKLKQHKSAWLKWMLDGTKRFYDNGQDLIIPDSVNGHIIEEFKQQDIIGTFITESTTVDSGSFIPTPELYSMFIELNDVDTKLYSKMRFATKLKQMGFDTTVRKRIDSKQVRCTIGLKFKEDIEDDEDEDIKQPTLIKENDSMSISFMD